MDAFDFADAPKGRKPKRTARGLILNLGTLAFLASSVCLIGYFVYTFIFPDNPYNPFPPATNFPGLITPTDSLLPTQTTILIPSSTAVMTATNTLTSTPTTAAATETLPAEETATTTLIPSASPSSSTHFKAQTGTPAYASHPNGCDGIYLVGNVIDINGIPLLDLTVDAAGSLGGITIDPEPSTSGSHPEFSLSGWQIKISNTLTASSGSVYVALYEAGSTVPISDLIIVDTYDDCDHNMIMVNFVQDR